MLCCKMKNTRFSVMMNLGSPDLLNIEAIYVVFKKPNIFTDFRYDKIMYKNHLK